MKTVEQSCEILSFGEATLAEGKKIAELAGRTCYKSLDKITEGSSEKFVERMINTSHLSVLEHATIYMKIPMSLIGLAWITDEFLKNKYTEIVVSQDDGYCYVTTNYRVILENKLEESLKYQCPYIEGKHIRRITVRMITNLQILGEFTRHRPFSFSVESTRYCAYSKDRFSNEITFIRPNFGIFVTNENVRHQWVANMKRAEEDYMTLAKLGATAQECAQVLPKATKTEIVMTGTTKDWNHYFNLRWFETTGPAHPQAKELAGMIYDMFKKMM